MPVQQINRIKLNFTLLDSKSNFSNFFQFPTGIIEYRHNNSIVRM